ncbi:MAG: phage tail assembly protein [Azoarcus sp.]|jgi:hypothetical protein|nr:phage tail assembly protein [Azoarcus sp.]
MELKLQHPVTVGRREVEALTFRGYTTAGDYLAFDQRGGVSQNIALIASLTGTDESLIRQLRGPDYLAASRIADKLIAGDSELAGEPAPEKKPSES